MQHLKIDSNNPTEEIIDYACKVLTSGGVVIHPTDTAYGLAVLADNLNAIEKIFQIKGRDNNKGLILAVKDLAMAKELGELNPQAEKLFTKFLPGPLTLLVNKTDKVASQVTGGSPKVALRLPNNEVTLRLSQALGVAYTTTSANPSGGANPYSLKTILESFTPEALALIDLALDVGDLVPNPSSTIIDTTVTPVTILREGPISLKEIVECLAS